MRTMWLHKENVQKGKSFSENVGSSFMWKGSRGYYKECSLGTFLWKRASLKKAFALKKGSFEKKFEERALFTEKILKK